MFTQQHYYAVAKRFRENFPLDLMPAGDLYIERRHDLIVARGAIVGLALEFARYFETDNPKFDPLKFLEFCSPDNDVYPLTELWESDNGKNG